MKSFKTIISAGFLASALALAGCGGGSNNEAEPEDDTTMVDPPGPSDLARAVDAAGIASDARDVAEMRHMGAVDKSTKTKPGRLAANGSSQAAYMYVMDVLGAKAAIQAEFDRASAALMTLEGIDTSGMTSAEQARIEGLVSHAEDDVDAINALLEDEDESLANAEARVKSGTKADGSAMERASQQAGKVADAVKTAIAASRDFSTAFNTAAPAKVTLMEAGVSVMTAEDILGGKTLSADGMDASAFGDSITTAADDTPATYKGIAGVFECVGAASGCTVEDGKISGPVLFVPSSLDGAYVLQQGNDDDVYVMATNYATYGYWLSDAGDAITLHANSHSVDGTSTNLLWTNANADGETSGSDMTASYSGKAGGFSERTVGEGDAAKHESGEFMANVNLKATFTDTAAEASLAGRIDGFAPKTGSAGSGHVNTGWVVELDASTTRSENQFSGDVEDNSDSLGSNHASEGNWNAVAYGESGKRPGGFVGAFDATFEDGSAAGAYSAK